MIGRLVAIVFFVLPAFAARADNESGPPHWSEVVGGAVVIDGDSLYVGDTEVRLHGIDAFEYEQTCGEAPCGVSAAQSLADMAGRHPVRCVGIAGDSCGRLIAVCRTRGRDLGGTQVMRGFALADRTMSENYSAEEGAARTAGVGAWAGTFTPPWTFRATLADDPDQGCVAGRLEKHRLYGKPRLEPL